MIESDLSFQDNDEVPWKRTRYLMIFLAAYVLFVGYSSRAVLPIAIVAMTNNDTNPAFTTFDWDPVTQGTVLSALFWGCAFASLPSSILIARYGPRLTLMGTCLVNDIATALTPVGAIAGGWGAVCALRIIQGISQSFLVPSAYAVLAKWTIPLERGLMMSICCSGSLLACAITMSIGGGLAGSSWGWPSVFYLFASLGLIWHVLWFIYGYDSPGDHPHISSKEREYILSFYSEQKEGKTARIPWLAIFSSLPVWGMFLAQICNWWGYNIVLNYMPTFMNDVLKYDIKQNGLLTALPFVLTLILTYVYGWTSDYLIQNHCISVPVARKLFTSISFLCPATCMIGLSQLGLHEKEWAVVLLVLTIGLNSGTCVGFQLNILDLSPNFAGILTGAAYTFINLSSISLPNIVAAIVTTKGMEDEWHIVFFITAGVYFTGTLAFLVLGKTETQSWNETYHLTNAQ